MYLTSAAGFAATQVKSPECSAVRFVILSRLEYESSWDTFVADANFGDKGTRLWPSLSQDMVRGGSPAATPHTVRVRIPSESPSWKVNGSIIGGTGKGQERRKNHTWEWEKDVTKTQELRTRYIVCIVVHKYISIYIYIQLYVGLLVVVVWYV